MEKALDPVFVLYGEQHIFLNLRSVDTLGILAEHLPHLVSLSLYEILEYGIDKYIHYIPQIQYCNTFVKQVCLHTLQIPIHSNTRRTPKVQCWASAADGGQALKRH